MSSELKVLSVSTHDNNGGAAKAAYRIHQGVRELGVESTMFVKYKSLNDPSIIGLSQIIHYNFFMKVFNWVICKLKNKYQHFVWSKYPNRENFYFSDLRSISTGHFLKKNVWNVIHLHWINQRFISLKELRKIRKPIIWTLHDSWPFCGCCHYFMDCEKYKSNCERCPHLHSNVSNDISSQVFKIKREIYSNLDLHIVAPSKWMAKSAKESRLLRNFPIEVIPNCIDTEVFRPFSMELILSYWRNLRININKKIILYAAFSINDTIKGYRYLLQALKYLTIQNVELIVFGTKGGDLEIDEGVSVRYVGYISKVEDIVSLYNIADVMVVPSISENLSCVIMESMSCGTPVTAFDIGGNSDMINHKVNGYLAKEKDSKDLANGIIWCIENNKDNKLSLSARNKVLENYTIDIVSNKYKDLYKKILNN